MKNIKTRMGALSLASMLLLSGTPKLSKAETYEGRVTSIEQTTDIEETTFEKKK